MKNSIQQKIKQSRAAISLLTPGLERVRIDAEIRTQPDSITLSPVNLFQK